MAQRSIYIDGLGHGATPIPLACRVGDMLVTSGIGGRDRHTGTMPATAADQLAGCFSNLLAVLEAGEMSLANVVKLSFTLREEGDREAVNAQWLAHFPDPSQRPARHVQVGGLRGAVLVQIEATAHAD